MKTKVKAKVVLISVLFFTLMYRKVSSVIKDYFHNFENNKPKTYKKYITFMRLISEANGFFLYIFKVLHAAIVTRYFLDIAKR